MSAVNEFADELFKFNATAVVNTNDNSEFFDLDKLVNELNLTNSSNEKKNILIKYPQCKKLLYYIYHPLWQYNITSNTCKKKNSLASDIIYNSIFILLDDLRNRKITGHDAIGCVNTFVNNNRKYEKLIWNIIDKDLKIRLDVKSINEVFQNYIPMFEVSLGYPFKNYVNVEGKKNIILDSSWFISHKLDGVRTITIIDKTGYIRFYSREGNEFSTLTNVRRELQKLNLKNIILDGEMCILDEDGSENFKSVVSQIKRKDFTIEHPRYLLFDCLTPEEFYAREGNTLFNIRYNTLNNIIPKNNNILAVVKQIQYNSQSFEVMKNEMLKGGWEGLMFRKNINYEGKRSKYLLKYKLFHDFETEVISIETGPFRIVNPHSGLEETIETLTNVIIKYKGNSVSVGSGFSLNERKKIYSNPNSIIGKTITVKYFEETQDKNGKISLRFPTVKCVFEGKRDV